MISSLSPLQSAEALTNPEYFVMRGRIIDKTLKARTGLFDLRVSLWTDENANDQNPENIDQSFWNETHSLELGSGGEFEIRVGTVRDLPVPFSFDTYEYLQLDARPGLETEYTIMDPRPSDAQIDRIHLVTLPYKSGASSGGGDIDTSHFVKLNAHGEISESILPGSVRTLLSSVDRRLNDIEQDLNDSLWQDAVYSQNNLEDEKARTGEVRYVIEEKELKVFDGDQWNSVGGAPGNGGGTPGPKKSYVYRELLQIHKSGTATPGLFYWDANHKEYYVGMANGSLRSLFGDKELPGRLQKKSWIDLRFADLTELKIDKTPGVDFYQDKRFGLQAKTSGQKKWKYAMAFPRAIFDPEKEDGFEFVMHTGHMNGNMMMGLARSGINLESYKNATYAGTRMGLFFKGERIDNRMYGRKYKDNTQWYRLYKRKSPWKPHTFYRVQILPTDEQDVQQVVIDQVDPDNWDTVVENLAEFKTSHALGAEGLQPFWALSGSSDYYLSGFRTY